jgi:hypothetical protein
MSFVYPLLHNCVLISIRRTAIGSHLGMNYACTYLGEWEQELFEKSDRLPTHYWRYVDDVWGLWEHGLEKQRDIVYILQI